ncbi:MAG: type II secretion system protein GspL [Candidatus Competibacteraceae bacterium]
MPAPLGLFRVLSPDQAEWLRPDGAVQRGPLAELAALSSSVRLLLVAPGETITLHPIPLPSRKRSTWARAVPYALEDALADDIETLHFALAAAPDDGRLPVAVIAHAQLRAWLETCSAAGLSPVAVVPEPLLLPWQPGDWSVLLEERRAVVRTGRWDGFAADRETLDFILNQALAEAGDAKPQRLRVWGGPPPERVGTDLIWQEEGPAEPLLLFTTMAQPVILNLLQGPYSRQAHWGRRLQPWRAAAMLAGIWLLIQGVTQVYDYQRLRQELSTLQTGMEQAYKDAVPGATRIVNPKAQLEARLRELTPSGGGGGFLDLLYRGGQPLTGFSELTLRGLSYRDGQLDLALDGGSPAVLDRLRQQLEQQPGLRTELRSTQREGQVESKVTLKKAAS